MKEETPAADSADIMVEELGEVSGTSSTNTVGCAGTLSTPIATASSAGTVIGCSGG
ncbi:MAG TPA: hypothetical protein VGS19_15675 [Streptosporangiaceae bacterium]|nr:hypothetical protein [Streptosporangiaceae bacterium]